MKKSFIILMISLSIPFFTNCRSSRDITIQHAVAHKNTQTMASPPALVYKTRKDYSTHVPVLMNAEKTRIISYPHPADLYFRGNLAYPTPLDNGYLLDNRGIGPQVAFLNYTYEVYSRLKEAPSMDQLNDSLLDKDPLVELWNCGARSNFKDEVKELNRLIKNGFPDCQPLVEKIKVDFVP